MIFDSREALVSFARRRAMRGLYDGQMTEANQDLIRLCSHRYHEIRNALGAVIIFTRDTGHHTGGWWKNPDYERCWHLSLSQRDPRTGETVPADMAFFQRLAEAFFEDDVRKTWLEGPYSPEGKATGVWHYRLFCDEAWNPILPRGEVYNTEFTEAGWKSFSEIHGIALEDVDAPFLTEGAR